MSLLSLSRNLSISTIDDGLVTLAYLIYGALCELTNQERVGNICGVHGRVCRVRFQSLTLT